MRFRGRSVRRKIVALLLVPLLSLTAMWSVTTYVTGREANQLLDVGTVVRNLGYPVEDVIQALQRERRQSLLYLADRRGANAVTELRGQTRATDDAVARLHDDVDIQDIRDDLAGSAARRVDDLVKGLDGLDVLRTQVEENRIGRDEAMESYDALVDPGYDLLAALHALENVEMDKQGRALVYLSRAREAFSREDALMSAILASGSIGKRDQRALSDRIAERRILYSTNLSLLPVTDRGVYEDYWHSAAARELTSYEDKVIAADPANAAHAVNADRWNTAAEKVLGDLGRMGRDAGDRYQQRVEPIATRIVVKAVATGVLGFVALLVSVVVSLRIGRRHVRDLTRLRKTAHEVSGVRLPSVMRRLAAGEQVDVETEAPRLEFGPDETGQVGQALNTLQRAAVEAAVKQADMRRGVSEVFVNLARRNQVLLHRQLTLLDAMERRTEDAEELADLFRLDHMTTRMRRHAEGLVILSGAAPSRQWRKPVQLMDVVRAAVAEVEDYERIEVRRLPRLAVDGPAVSDLTHLIAELLENATVFSPPHTAVQVLGVQVSNGYTLEIHDRGLGMSPDQLLDANLRLAETPEFELSDTDRLGLFVVSRLAQRQGVRVSLQPSPYGGTTAVVLVPGALLTDSAEGARPAGPAAADTGPETAEDPGLDPLAQVPVPLPRRSRPAALDGPAEPRTAASEDGPAAADPADDQGALFRDRTRGRRRPAAPNGPRTAPGRDRIPSGEQHQQAGDQAPTGGLTPLPRRPRTPVLVSDHGRTVDGARTPDDDSRQDRPQPAEPPAAARHTPDEPPTDGTPAPATTPKGLPRRVRQASLAPQLKTDPGAEPPADRPAAPAADDRDAEAVRARMASLQRGWQRGRRENDRAPHAPTPPDPGTADGAAGGATAPPRTTSGEDGP
ncbi:MULTISPECIES: nitrate- and nitrite sensing domain-containing protein [unclassified Streptomyces]|uniref:nitrate- and nitrite sensing domain-containing protein n=1 Tax=unclassified Streptomyces TaxID=2593676 RepID=UPI0003A05B94|nr:MULTISPECIES: nitrate- and nitrite sensing domain-containing protein [unclassified Streptomyces]MYT28935.1 histidine kinase [Streptomyces sp. SID8354]